VYGTGFWPNTSGNVFFDHNYDFQQTIGSNWMCGALNEFPCEPSVSVTSDANGNFTTSLRIPPGKRVSFLGAGTYFIAANLPIGGGSDASAAFKVLGNFAETESKPLPGPFRVPTVTGSNFAPFSLTGNQSEGYVWYDVDEDYQFYSDPDEPKIKVYVRPDGTLSKCPDSACAVPNPFNGRLWGRVRVDISHEADANRSTEQRVEASFTMVRVPCSTLGC